MLRTAFFYHQVRMPSQYIPPELFRLNNIHYFYSVKQHIDRTFSNQILYTMANNRNYNFSDVNMIMAAKIIAVNFKANLSELSILRTNWTPEYADAITRKIEYAVKNYLGIDARKELRKTSGKLARVMQLAKIDLAAFKTQIDIDFSDDGTKLEEMLKRLSFTKNLRAVQRGNQEALIELLYAFKTNMTDNLKQEIIARGMTPSLIDQISGYANVVKEANVKQEFQKGRSKKITHETAEVYNAIYHEIIGICKIASKHYQNNPVKKEQFTFSKVVANLNNARKTNVRKKILNPGTQTRTHTPSQTQSNKHDS